MKSLFVTCIVIISLGLTQVSCIPVPAKVEKRITDPGKNYYDKGYSRGYNINYAEKQLEILSSELASRADVIRIFGVPLHYTSNSISYEACQGEHGIGVILFSYPLGASAVPIDTEQGECYEVLINFDADDHLDAYESIPYSGNQTKYNKCDEEQIYRELASQGDPVARSLWEGTDTFRAQQLKNLAEKGNPISQLQYYQLTHYPSNCGTSEAHRDYRNERLRYICQAADNKYAPAMLELVRILVIPITCSGFIRSPIFPTRWVR